jgi:hypothetical protein
MELQPPVAKMRSFNCKIVILDFGCSFIEIGRGLRIKLLLRLFMKGLKMHG